MNTSLRLLLIIEILLFGNTCFAQGAWQAVTSVYGNNPTFSYAETTNKVFAIGEAGVYASNKIDFFWEVDPAFSNINVLAIAASNDTVSVIQMGMGSEFDTRTVLRMSFNEGASWEDPIVVNNNLILDIKLSYVAGQLILATTQMGNGLLIKSSDLGLTWTNHPMPNYIDYAMIIRDKDEAHIVYSVSSTDTSRNFVYSVLDNSWHAIPGTNANGLIQSYIFNNRVYTALNASSIFSISSCALDGSDNQLLYSNSDVLLYDGFVEINGTLAFLITEITTPFNAKDLYVSNDNGLTFTFQSTLENTPNWINFAIPLETGECIVRSGSNLYLMSENFEQYELINGGFVLNELDYLTSVNNEIYVSEPGQFFGKSNDNGANFVSVVNSNGYLSGEILQQGDTILYETLDNNLGSVFQRSFDNGLTFESVVNSIPLYNPTQYNQKSALLNNKLYLISSDFVDAPIMNMSVNAGNSFTTIANPSATLGIIHAHNGKLYYFGEDLFVYNEQSNTWQGLNSPISNNISFLLEDCKMRSLGGNLWIKNEQNEQAILLADGITWAIPNESLFDVAQTDNTVYGLGLQYIFASTDWGQTWQATQLELPVWGHTEMFAHGSDLFIYGGPDLTASCWRTEAPQVVSGMVYYDANNNGIYDIGETGVPNILIHSENSGEYAMSGVTGSFNIDFSGEEDQLTVEVNSPDLTAIPENITLNSFNEILIGIQVNGTIADLGVDAVLLSPFRPGFSTSIYAIVSNLGNVAQGGELTLTLPQLTTFTSSSLQPSNQTSNSVTWTISEIAPFETRLIFIELLNDVSAVLGNNATFNLNLISASSDEHLENNALSNSSVIVGSYDPNDKACSRGESLTPTQLNENNEFEYLIRFQNTGTYYAENIVIQDTLSSYFDLATMRIIATSDTMNVTFGENNLVNFNFPLIFLPDSTTNEPESHGFVKYAIRTKPNLELGTVLRNTAYIYFDFNEPIITNTTETIYDLQIGLEMQAEQGIFVYPNPTNATIKLIGYSDQTITVSLSDLSGKIVSMKNCVNGELDLSELNAGIYLGVIQGNSGKEAQRFKVVKM